LHHDGAGRKRHPDRLLYDWGLVLADEMRAFKVGSSEPVVLMVDERDPIPAIAKVIDLHGILIPLEDSGAVLEALREGKVLTIVGTQAKFSFKLTGTNEAIAELAACVAEHRGEKVALPDQRRENSLSISASFSSI
jgi:hypothetical protein